MKLTLFNTLTRKKEIFKPITKGKVGMYSCGPTVYSYAHVGNLRSYVFSDLLKRVLLFNGYRVKHVMNVTDVGHLVSDSDEGEDKMERAAKKEGKKASEIADYYLKVFQEDLHRLNIITPALFPKASEHIKEQISLIEKLEKKGFTYKTSDGIYFDSSKFKDYGKLARLNLKGLAAGKRISIGGKKHKTDFALWKFSPAIGKRQQEWDSSWGVGFPGWHVECSAMGMKYLGKHFDIHTGGEDLVPVHHTNEIAQSEAATGKKFVNYWLHGAFLKNKGKKVSKSTGGLFTVSELVEKGYDPFSFRYLCLMTHFRKALNFSLANLDAAEKAYKSMKRKVAEIRKQLHKGNDETKKYYDMFLEAVNDDINLPKALRVVWLMLNDYDFAPKKKLKLLEKFDVVLGLNVKEMREVEVEVPKEVRELLVKREKLRKKKKWAEADVLRERIREFGFVVEDLEFGPGIEKV